MEKTLEQLCEEAISTCAHTRCNKCEYGPHLTPASTGHSCQAQMMADYLKKNGVKVDAKQCT